jgi:hypothetical protein
MSSFPFARLSVQERAPRSLTTESGKLRREQGHTVAMVVGKSRIPTETGDALLRGTRVRPVDGVGPLDLISCGLGHAGVFQFASGIALRPAVRLWFGSLTIVFQRTSVVGEVASTFPSFRFPELSQPILTFSPLSDNNPLGG